ncbi:MAG: DUF1840 domain-containing protein [Hylemonella sp.]
MLYKFKSKVTGDLIMLEPNGRRVLQIINKYSPEGKGILLPEQMPAAIEALQAAIAKEEAEQKAAQQESSGRAEPSLNHEAVSLRQRASPFIDMMQRCHRADKEIVWGV